MILLCLLSLLTTETLCQNASVLRFGVFISQNSSDSFEYAGFLPSLEIGFETVNDSSILTTEDGRYEIMYNISDAMCDAAASLTSFIDLINGSKPMIMLLGSDCSVSTEPVASISHHWNLVQISQSSSSPHLSNTDVFPKFLRTVSSDAEVATGVSSIMKHFKWSRVALLTQSEAIFTSFSTEFKDHINNCSLRLLGEYTFTSETSASSAVEAFQRSSARIIFLNMYEENAAEVLCLAYRRNMKYPNYVWIVHNWYNLDWWMQNDSGCTDLELRDMLNMQLIIDHYPRIDEADMDKPNIGNITWNDYKTMYDERFDELFTGTNVSYNLEDGAFMYDTVWAAVLALNRIAEMGYSLTDFDYSNENLSKVIYNEALEVEFFGLTGHVTFDRATGDRPGRIRILQYRINETDETDIDKVQFGKVKNRTFVYVAGENTNTVFPDGIPADEEYIRISLPLFAIYCVLAVLGVIFACICLWFNLWFRNHKIVKLSSPYVNVMIIAGAIIFYTTVILFGVDENIAPFSFVDGLCQARIWLCVIGFSLLFGTIFAKAWRIYYIFNHLTPNSKTEIKDIYLFGVVAVLLILDVIFMLPTTIISSSILRRQEREISSDNDGELPEIIGICDSEYSFEWLIVLFVYKGLVLSVGLLLAFEIRKVKIVSLNESRFIGMSVYGAVIVSIALTPIGFSLEESPTTQYAILGIMILASVTIILVLIFVSKMYKVYRDPKGKTVQIGVTTTDQPQQPPRMTFQCSEEIYKSQIQKLNGEVAMLRKRLKDNNLDCDDDHAVDVNHVCMTDDNHMVTDNDVVDGMNHKAEDSTEV